MAPCAMTDSPPRGFSRGSFSKMRARPNSLADVWLRRGAVQCGKMVSRPRAAVPRWIRCGSMSI